MSALSAFLNWRAGKKAAASTPSLTRKNPPFDPAAKSKLPKEIVNAIGVLSTNQLEQLRKELAIPYPERPYKKELSNNDKESLLQRWQDLSINEKQDYFKRALNNIPKVMKSIEQEKATIDNAMSRPLLRIELEKLLSTVAN